MVESDNFSADWSQLLDDMPHEPGAVVSPHTQPITAGATNSGEIPISSNFATTSKSSSNNSGTSSSSFGSSKNGNNKGRFPWWMLLLLLLLLGGSASAAAGFNPIYRALKVVGIEGRDGKDGNDGQDGIDGQNGKIVKQTNIVASGVSGSGSGADGADGSNGADGADGADGAKGDTGTPGSNDCISGICVSRQVGSPDTQEEGNINIDGAILADSLTATTVSATTITGNGSGLTALNASMLASGTVSDSRLSANVALLNASNSFSVGQTVLSGAAGATGLIVKGAASQSANLQEWQNSAGTVLASVGSSGVINANQGVATWDGVVSDGGIGPVSGGINTGIYGYNALIGYAGGVEKFRAVANKGVAVGRSSTGNSGAVEKLGVGEWVTADDLATMMVTAGATTHKALVVQGYTSQTANLQEWQNSAGTVLSSISNVGAGQFASLTSNTLVGGGTSGLTLGAANGGNYPVLIQAQSATVATFRAIPGAGEAHSLFSTIQTDKPSVVVRGVASQTANLQEWQNSAGTTKAYIDASGNLGFDANQVRGIYWDGPTFASLKMNGGNGLVVAPYNASYVGMSIQGRDSQTADLQQWLNSVGTKLASVTSAGRIYAGDSSTTTYSYIAPDGSIGMRSSGNEWTFTYASTGVNLNTAIGASNFSPGGVGTTPGRLDTGGGGLSLSERFNDVYIRNFSPGFTVAQFGTASGSTVAQLLTPVASGKGLVIRANATTPGNLQEWQDSSSTLLMGVTSSGGIRFNTAAITMSQSANALTFVGDVGKAGVVQITNDFGDISTVGATRFFAGSFNSNVGMEINYSLSAGHGTALIKGGGQNIIGFTDPNSGVYVNFYKPVKALDSSTVALAVRGATSQTANLQEWQNSAGTVLSRITAAGDLYTPGGSVIALGSQYLWNSNGIKYNVDAGNSHTFFVGGSEVMRVDSTANVGIGDDTSPDAKLDVSNTSTAGAVLQLTNSAGTCDHTPGAVTETVSCSSDERLKTDIQSAASVLSEINGLHVFDYTIIATGQKATGLIAQDVMQTNPEMVHMGEDGYYKVDSYNSWKLLKGIQELSSNIDNLQSTFTTALEQTNGNLEQTNQKLADLGLRVDDLSATLQSYADQLADHNQRIQSLEAKVQQLEQAN